MFIAVLHAQKIAWALAHHAVIALTILGITLAGFAFLAILNLVA